MKQEVWGGLKLNETESPNGEAHTEKRPYEKPSILWEEEIDVRKTLAVACGKIGGQGGFCNAAPTS